VKQKAKFLFFCMIFVVGSALGQKTTSLVTFKPSVTKKSTIFLGSQTNTILPKEFYDFSISCLSSNKFIVTASSKNKTFIPANFYTQNFGFFCKKEVQLQKAIKVPFVFRLGSVEMCDRLEGKGR
jgi:hypothetical protein